MTAHLEIEPLTTFSEAAQQALDIAGKLKDTVKFTFNYAEFTAAPDFSFADLWGQFEAAAMVEAERQERADILESYETITGCV
jgi:hypothetical protein